ncbi:MAG: hypothetical protein RR860_10330, partial [Janthinobacterium sp.]
SALLLQNPRFHAGMTSPVGGLFRGMLNQLGAGSEFGPVVTKEQRKRLGHMDSLPDFSREDMPKNAANAVPCSMFMP